MHSLQNDLRESSLNIIVFLQSPKRFEDVFEEMISFLEEAEHWEDTEMELAARGVCFTALTLRLPVPQERSSTLIFDSHAHQVRHLNFYDIVLDFILMDSFEDLENPPFSIQNVINNRWLNSSFKETVRTYFGFGHLSNFIPWSG